MLPTPIPEKGKILTHLSLWWFRRLADAGIAPNHVISANTQDYPAPFTGHGSLDRRSMLVRGLHMVAVECVARSYLAGSALSEYRATQSVCGVPLPPGLQEGSRLPRPIFTPTTKGEAARGEHDEPLTYAQVEYLAGKTTAAELQHITLGVLGVMQAVCEPRGLLVADTKVEIGYDHSGCLTLGDEVGTMDSSRFWPVGKWQPGGPQPSYDKQPVRDWAAATGWDKTAPGPALPEDIVAATQARYFQGYQLITGERWR